MIAPNRPSNDALQAKPEAEQVVVAVDPIIDAAAFYAVQTMLKARDPKAMPPRVVTGPILLTGIATCASCVPENQDAIATIPARPARSRARLRATAVRSPWKNLTGS